MEAKITKTLTPKTPRKNTIVYVNSDLSDLIDKEFFNKHQIWDLTFVCKTWNKVKSEVNKLEIDALRSIFKNETISFSQKAGCSCGCSPGYIVEPNDGSWFCGKEQWIDLDSTEEELNSFRQELQIKYAKLLLAELEAKESLV